MSKKADRKRRRLTLSLEVESWFPRYKEASQAGVVAFLLSRVLSVKGLAISVAVAGTVLTVWIGHPTEENDATTPTPIVNEDSTTGTPEPKQLLISFD